MGSIVYDRETLLALRNSPLSQTPPKHMAKIPGVTVPLDAEMTEHGVPAPADHNSGARALLCVRVYVLCGCG